MFEDLVLELKEESLLEDTVLEDRAEEVDNFGAVGPDPDFEDDPQPPAAPVVSEYDLHLGHTPAPVEEPAPQTVAVTGNDEVPSEPVQDKPQVNGREFFKKRAVAEVSSLQMVEHVLTGVEREYMKVKPQVFDDLKAKLALNKFLKVSEQEVESDDHKSAEFELMQETEAWCTALADRDAKIYVSSLRQYCENTKPALSSQAMLSLCRFYRNLPYSESTRAKYDFLLTRLFTRAAADETRIGLFKREEALKHLENLYKDWASVPLYSADDDESKVMLTALSFDDLAQESENASSFDQLIESDFFSRLRMFKESIAELFFAPQVAIAAIEANVRIGNSYVKLISAERQKMDADSIQAKYGNLDQDSVSDATARTLQLVDLLKAPAFEEVPSEAPEVREPVREVIDRPHHEPVADRKIPEDEGAKQPGFVAGLMKNAFAVNKWLLIGSILLVGASLGLYVWANYFVEDTAPSSGVRVVSQDNPVVREHIKTAKVANDILYGLMDPTWDALPKEKRVEYVQKLLAQGPELGYTQVNLTSKDGKQAAYGSKDKIDIQMP
ncbi:MAG: hypothetical protein JO314_12760 [Acidobacteria bacterium]|nr:hypothetical protein [Acidobacteriota bacterium]